MSNMIITATLRCYKRGNYCEASFSPLWISSLFHSWLLAKHSDLWVRDHLFFQMWGPDHRNTVGPSHDPCSVEGGWCSAVPDHQWAISWLWPIVLSLCALWSSPLEKSVSATNLWLYTWQRFQQGTTVSQVEVTCNVEYWRIQLRILISMKTYQWSGGPDGIWDLCIWIASRFQNLPHFAPLLYITH